jgi:hypothetical protein
MHEPNRKSLLLMQRDICSKNVIVPFFSKNILYFGSAQNKCYK